MAKSTRSVPSSMLCSPESAWEKARTGMKISASDEHVAKPYGAVAVRSHDAEGRPADRALPGVLRPRAVEGGRPSGREEICDRVADRGGDRSGGESPRPAAPGRGGQGLSIDALAEGGPRPRPRGLLQDVNPPQGRRTDEIVSMSASITR